VALYTLPLISLSITRYPPARRKVIQISKNRFVIPWHAVGYGGPFEQAVFLKGFSESDWALLIQLLTF
jgi:hypothetical protein